MEWEMVIGLEVHVQLGTRSKMFCGCPAVYGAEPNTTVCPVCLGLPGALPVPNAEAVRLGTLGALTLGCEIHPHSVFARKNYFYPDLPKGYQISQYDMPLATKGSIEIESPERGTVNIGVTRLHLEEDTGKSLHDRFPGKTAIDLNRCGIPLAEIVSEPDLRSPGEAKAYLVAVRERLIYAGVSECSMEKGSLRVDANISIRKTGDPFGTKTEIKNMNSFANVERALNAEMQRQVALVERGEAVTQVTLTFNADTGQVKPLRSKEEAHDYRYFADPDLPPLLLDEAWIQAQREALPEGPEQRRDRYQAELGLTAYDARTLVQEPAIAEYFEAVIASGVEAKTAANWVLGEVISAWNQAGRFAVEPARIAELIGLVSDDTLSLQAAKKVFPELALGAESPREVADRLGLVQVRDTDALTEWVSQALNAHPDEVERYRDGELKLIGFFVGQVMKQSGGKADPKGIQPVLRKLLDQD